MTWNDTRLAWDPLKFNNMTEITLPVNKIWVIINLKALNQEILIFILISYQILYFRYFKFEFKIINNKYQLI